MSENSGGDVNYYRVEVAHPKRTEPYVAECEDIIAALGMDFFEGEAFKAAWRKAAQRTLGVGKEGNTALRDAQKMAHYGARCLAIEGYRLTYASGMSAEAPRDESAPWIPYVASGAPPDLEYVEVMTACGEPQKGPTGRFVWGGHGTKSRITHYRPAQP